MHILTSYRAAHALSRAELAVKLGCSLQLVVAIETGHRRITGEKAKEWSKILLLDRAMLCPEVFGA